MLDVAELALEYSSEPDLVCQTCGTIVPLEAMGVDMAKCRSCKSAFKLAAISFPTKIDQRTEIPPHYVVESQEGTCWTLTVRIRRNIVSAFYWLLFVGWISIFVLGMHDGIAPEGRLFVRLLAATALIPLFKAVMRTWGRYSISVKGNRALVFVGISKLGWVRTFDWTALRKVRLKEKRGGGRHKRITHSIVLEADIDVEFGADMAEDQLRYFAAAIVQNSNRNTLMR
jgi:hypothetical protein